MFHTTCIFPSDGSENKALGLAACHNQAFQRFQKLCRCKIRLHIVPFSGHTWLHRVLLARMFWETFCYRTYVRNSLNIASHIRWETCLWWGGPAHACAPAWHVPLWRCPLERSVALISRFLAGNASKAHSLTKTHELSVVVSWIHTYTILRAST